MRIALISAVCFPAPEPLTASALPRQRVYESPTAGETPSALLTRGQVVHGGLVFLSPPLGGGCGSL